MATRKKIELFIEINNEKEFETILNKDKDKLICAEIYCDFSGSCLALDRLFTKIKLEWSEGEIVLLKVLADEIEVLERFHNQSEPIYMFIVNKRVTKVFRGVDSMRFAEVAKKELQFFKQQLSGVSFRLPTYDINEATPDEMKWLNCRAAERQQESSSLAARRAARQAMRKRHRAELMVPHLENLNFVLFWPHATHAHPELYERWDLNNIIMVGREELQLTKEKALDILYAGDAPVNEASLYKLLSGPALVICFRCLDDDKHFVTLVRQILYEDMQMMEESNKQPFEITAYDYYKTYSPSKERILQERREKKLRLKEETREKRARRLSEMQRLARQAIEEAIEAKRAEKEQLKLELLKSGNLAALDDLRDEPDDEEVDIDIPEELPDESVEEESEEEDENEYFPPAGLVIPGLYAPPNDIAKANGLATLFPNLVAEHVTPKPEVLPPHVLVMLHLYKRHKAVSSLQKYTAAIIHMGIFQATTPFDAAHVAYSVKQYDAMQCAIDIDDLKLCFMVSTKKDLPLLELMDLSPLHVSRDGVAGENECAAMFRVDYGDHYPEFEDFEE